MKQLRKTEWRRGYPIKKNLALCAWGMLALAGFAGILARGGRSPFAAAPAWILQNYISVSARFEPAAYKKRAGGAARM